MDNDHDDDGDDDCDDNEAIKVYKVGEGKHPRILNNGGVRSTSQSTCSTSAITPEQELQRTSEPVRFFVTTMNDCADMLQ